MLTRIFLSHPQSVDETYFEHLSFATRFALTLAVAAGAALVHAIIPCLFDKTASQIVARLYERTKNRSSDGSSQSALDSGGQTQQSVF